MKFKMWVLALSAAAMAATAGAAVATAADLGGFRGSVKDDDYAPMPRASLRHCYVRIDTGYAWSGEPDVRWFSEVTQTDYVREIDFEDAWFVEGGLGCSTGGSRAWRAELMLGYHSERKYDGEPPLWNPPAGPPQLDDPLHTAVKSTTLMVNLYKDLGSYRGWVPYIGAGVGVSYNQIANTYFTENVFLTNSILGDNNISFAWSLMAGVSYNISSRTTLDLGYRYMDLGKIASQNGDTAGFWNPKVYVDDLTSHEFKVGFRYRLGSSRY